MIQMIYWLMRKIELLYWYLEEKRYKKKYSLHPSFKFKGRARLYGEGDIIGGEGSYIGHGSWIQAYKNQYVRIGKGCMISHNVRIYTCNLVPDQNFKNSSKKRFGNVTIGNYAWIGVNVFIKEGITIGEESIVGANSVVIKNVKPYSIVGGCPAKFIRMKKC